MELIDSKTSKKALISLQDSINEMLDKEMQLFLEPIPESLKEILNYYYSQGGKRLRPALLIAVAFTYEADENLGPFALTIELIHTMSLYHDDYLDKAKERRGAPTVHEKWDVTTAIVGGDIFHAAIHGHILSAIQQNRVKNPEIAIRFLVDLIQITEFKIGAAVIEEMRLAKSDRIPELDETIAVTAGKTAPLFAFSGAAAAYLANQDETTVENMYEMGWKIGYAFQLLDDLIDFFKSDKDIGGDLREDKKTPLLVLAYHKNPSKVIEYRKKRSNLNTEDIIRFRSDFIEEIIQILKWILQEIKEAKSFLDSVPQNPGKTLITAIFSLLEDKSDEISRRINSNEI